MKSSTNCPLAVATAPRIKTNLEKEKGKTQCLIYVENFSPNVMLILYKDMFNCVNGVCIVFIVGVLCRTSSNHKTDSSC